MVESGVTHDQKGQKIHEERGSEESSREDRSDEEEEEEIHYRV